MSGFFLVEMAISCTTLYNPSLICPIFMLIPVEREFLLLLFLELSDACLFSIFLGNTFLDVTNERIPRIQDIEIIMVPRILVAHDAVVGRGDEMRCAKRLPYHSF